MFEVFGRTGAPILGERNFRPLKFYINLPANLNDIGFHFATNYNVDVADQRTRNAAVSCVLRRTQYSRMRLRSKLCPGFRWGAYCSAPQTTNWF